MSRVLCWLFGHRQRYTRWERVPRWNLPEVEDIVFRVTRDPARKGHYRRDRYDRPEIANSSAGIGYTASLADVMAHEMIHLHEDRLGILYKTGAEHSTAFRRFAARVCRFHGFDPRLFIEPDSL